MEQAESQQREQATTGVGHDLRKAREAAGLSRADIAARTKIAERHIIAIEEDRFADLAGRAYAIGFARTYARSIGMDEADVAGRVKEQVDATGAAEPRYIPAFEPGDPARVPTQRLAWLAGAAVVMVLVLVAVFWKSLLSPEADLPDLVAQASEAPAAAVKPVAPRPVAAGPVVLAASQPGVWVQVTDAAGTKLIERELQLNERWIVPPQAQAPKLRTGRPDALLISVGDKPVPPLADKAVTMSGVSLVAADLLARGATPTVSAAASPVPPAARPVVTSTGRTPAPRPAAATRSPSPAPSITGSAVEPAPAPAPSPSATVSPETE